MSAVTYTEMARDMRHAIAATDAPDVEWHFGSEYTLENIRVTFWADEAQNSWMTVEALPLVGQVRVYAEHMDGDAPIPEACVEAAKALGRAMQRDIAKSLEIIEKDYSPVYYTAGEGGAERQITPPHVFERARSESRSFLSRQTISLDDSSFDPAEREALRVVAGAFIEELLNADPAECYPSFSEEQIAEVSRVVSSSFLNSTSDEEYQNAVDTVMRFNMARQEVSA